MPAAHHLILALIAAACARAPADVPYPGDPPGPADSTARPDAFGLRNAAITASWTLRDGTVRPGHVRPTGAPDTVGATGNELFILKLADGRTIAASDLTVLAPPWIEPVAAAPHAPRLEDRFPGRRLHAGLGDENGNLAAYWTATLRDGAAYIVTETTITPVGRDLPLAEIVMLDANVPGATIVGEVSGSPVVAGSMFLAAEDPLSAHAVAGERVTATRARPALRAGQSLSWSSVVGVAPPRQLRRGFLAYLERRRAHPYRQFLHYNSWYHLNIARPDHRMTEAECLDTIGVFARQLIEGRGVPLDAFVWDDGWDDFDSLWGFHDGFPGGFTALRDAAAAHGAAMGVWMSPWGGYGQPRERRLAFGRANGYETNANGFSMAGPKYGGAFRDRCLEMMRGQGVVFFKFDGMGGGNMVDGADAEFAGDIDAVWRLAGGLRRENPDVFISATTGTWPSPFWTLHADSVWRQGGDTGFHGAGNGREQWITYRDMLAYQRIVMRAPLYPLNSVMFHGLTVGERADPARMPRDETSIAHETWMMFACGTGLLELYVDPNLLTGPMWDELARAAKWARAGADALIDTHWIGGDPERGEVYGFAGWTPGKAVLTVRNPDEREGTFVLNLGEALELPPSAARAFRPVVVRTDRPRTIPRIDVDRAIEIPLAPFEVLVLDLIAAPDPAPQQVDVFVSGETPAGPDGPGHTYRIPALVTTSSGVVLAFAEGRRDGRGDSGDIDMLLRRSTDGGETWEPAQIVWDDGPNTCGNPCPVVDRETGTVWLLMTHNLGSDREPRIIDQTAAGTRTVWVMRSEDDGATWAEPVEITGTVKDPGWTWYATGPGNGIQLTRGEHAERLLVPCDHIEAGTKRYYSHVIYSDDHGATWRLGGTTPTDQVNECAVAELPDGRLMLNMRNYDRTKRARAVSVSDDGGMTWSAVRHDETLIEPICQASLIAHEIGGRGVLLFSNPASAEARVNMTVRASYDDGGTWPVSVPVREGPSAYSSLAVLPDGTIGCLYEGGAAHPYERITLARIDARSLAAPGS